MFSDEAIIKSIIKAQNLANRTLEGDIQIENAVYQFSERTYFNELFSMCTPMSFEDMDADVIGIKYSGSTPPQIVIANPDGSINIAFHYTGIESPENELKSKAKEMERVIKRMHPSFVFDTQAFLRAQQDTLVQYFDFVSSALDEDVYNLIFLLSIQNYLLIGTFNCPEALADAWKPYTKLMLKSIYIPHKESEEDV